MRIVQLIDSLEPGGAERMAVNLANVLADKIAFSGLIVSRNEGDLRRSITTNVKYYFLNKKRTIDIKAIFSLRKYVIENQVGYIHAHSSSFFLATLLKVVYPKIKIIWHDHYGNSEFLDQRPFYILKIASLLFSNIIVVNENLKNWCFKKLLCKKIIFLPNFPELSTSVKKETVLKGNIGKRIICLANLRPQKNHFLVVEIAEFLKKTNPDWSFHLIGKDFNDDYSKSLKKAIIEKKLEETIYLYGSCNDVAVILTQVDIGLITSVSEGLPVALLEYGKMGLPVVSSSVGDITNVIKNKINGILIPNFEAISYHEALANLIKDETLMIQYGKELKDEINKNYTPESVSNKYIEFIHA